MRPTVLEAKNDLPEIHRRRLHQRFRQRRRSSTAPTATKTATRTIALAGGSHAEHWITALDLLGRMHHFKVVTYLKMGCPLTTEQVPLVMGDNRPYPQCHDWNDQVMAKLIADRPDYVFTTSTRPWNIKPGDVMPGSYIGIWQSFVGQQHSDPGHARHPVAGAQTASRSFPRTALPTAATPCPAGSSAPRYSSDRNPTLDFVAPVPADLKPLDMSDAVCRPDFCRAVEGNVLMYHDSHHFIGDLHANHDPRAGRQIGPATGWW